MTAEIELNLGEILPQVYVRVESWGTYLFDKRRNLHFYRTNANEWFLEPGEGSPFDEDGYISRRSQLATELDIILEAKSRETQVPAIPPPEDGQQP